MVDHFKYVGFSGTIESCDPENADLVHVVDYRRLQTELEALRIDARRWQAVRDGSYELLHNLSIAPAQYREQIIDEVTK